MPPPSNHSVGPLDIQKLLELLNASEAREETVDDPQEAPDDPAVSTPSTPPLEPDAVDPQADPLAGVDNRFAAHIVRGMSKLKKG